MEDGIFIVQGPCSLNFCIALKWSATLRQQQEIQLTSFLIVTNSQHPVKKSLSTG